MKIAIGGDHAGFSLKSTLAEMLRGAGHTVLDVGATRLDPDDDYPDFALAIGTAVARGKAVEWAKRQQALLEEEWAVHEECIRAGREALKRFYDRGKGATLGDIARMFAEGSRLGRLASGLATDKTEVTGEDGGPIRVELEAALKKVYGDIVDVAAVPSASVPLLQGEGSAPPELRAKGLPGTDEGK